MRLYKFVPERIDDAWGLPIDVMRMEDFADVDIIGEREYDNGYEKVMIDVASDGMRTFYRPIEVDYFSGSDWYEDGQNGDWRQAKRLSKVNRYVDAAYNPITPEKLIEAFGE